jgi:hypothetical protein
VVVDCGRGWAGQGFAPTTGARDFFLRADFFPGENEANLRVSLVGSAQEPCFLEENGGSKKAYCAGFEDVGGFLRNRAHKTG